MSTLREVAGPKISPYLQILYAIFNFLLIGALTYTLTNVGGSPKSLSSSGSVNQSAKSFIGEVQPCNREVDLLCATPSQPDEKVTKDLNRQNYLHQRRAEDKARHSPDAFPRCSMDMCFNFTRCENMDELLVYHYETTTPSKWFLNALKKSPYYTTDPEKACIFFAAVDRTSNESRDPPLSTLPYWNNGMNHVIISTVNNWAKWQNPKADSLQNASTMTTLTHQTIYRSSFDISIPPPQKRSYVGLQKLKASNRKYFLTFKGMRPLGNYGVGGFRSNPAMRALHNGEDVIVATSCLQNSNMKYLKENPASGIECLEDEMVFKQYKRDDLMNSTFGLAPAYSSSRLLEVLSAGSIPVLISDNFVLPFDTLIRWDKCLLLFPTSQTIRILPTLRALKQKEVEFRQDYCRFIYREFFENDDKIVETIALAMKSRLYGMLPRLNANLPLPPQHLSSQPL